MRAAARSIKIKYCFFDKLRDILFGMSLRLSKNFVFRTASRSKPCFRANLEEKPRPADTFFFPCINSEIHKVNCRIAAREGGLGNSPGLYEFAKQIRLNACCRTKHKNQILLFRQAKGHTFQYVPNCKRIWWICPVPYTLFTTFSRTSDSLGLRTAISATRW